MAVKSPFHLRRIYICFGLSILTFISIDVKAQNHREVAGAVRNELINAVLKDSEEQRDCLKDLSAEQQQEFRKNSDIRSVDLNHDGRAEYLVTGAGTCSCGNANCSMWLYERSSNGVRQILETMGISFRQGRTSHNGYEDVIVESHDSAATVYRSFYSFDGKKYGEYRAEFVNLETHQSKPAQVEIRFPKGATSTVVQGHVSIGFPDTYTLKATPGQKISIEILKPADGVKFLVQESKASETSITWQKKWSGTVTGAGSYRINVDSENTVAYSMRVTVE